MLQDHANRHQINLHELDAWDLGYAASDEFGLYADREVGKSLVYGSYLCRIVHEDELRKGTFLGYHHEPDCRLQRWGHFNPSDGRPHSIAVEGEPLFRRPETMAVLAGDLTLSNLTVHGDQLVFLAGSHDHSGILLLVDHTVDAITSRPQTTLWYSTSAYERDPRDRTIVERVTVDSATEVRLVDGGL